MCESGIAWPGNQAVSRLVRDSSVRGRLAFSLGMTDKACVASRTRQNARFAVQPDERPTPRFQSPAPTAVDLGWRMPLLPALDRAVARNHWFRGRLRILSGNRETLSRNSAGAISALGRLRRSKRSGLLRGGG